MREKYHHPPRFEEHRFMNLHPRVMRTAILRSLRSPNHRPAKHHQKSVTADTSL